MHTVIIYSDHDGSESHWLVVAVPFPDIIKTNAHFYAHAATGNSAYSAIIPVEQRKALREQALLFLHCRWITICNPYI